MLHYVYCFITFFYVWMHYVKQFVYCFALYCQKYKNIWTKYVGNQTHDVWWVSVTSLPKQFEGDVRNKFSIGQSKSSTSKWENLFWHSWLCLLFLLKHKKAWKNTAFWGHGRAYIKQLHAALPKTVGTSGIHINQTSKLDTSLIQSSFNTIDTVLMKPLHILFFSHFFTMFCLIQQTSSSHCPELQSCSAVWIEAHVCLSEGNFKNGARD